MRVRSLSTMATLLGLSCLLHSSAAKADSYTFTLSGTGITGSGTLTTVADPTIAGAQDITSLTGSLNNYAITGDPNSVGISLVAAPTNPSTAIFPTGPASNFFFTYNNVLYPDASTAFDVNGLAFISTDGITYNIADGSSGLVYEAFTDDLSFDQRTFDGVPVQFTLADATTPEPASIALLGTGLLGVAGVLRRRVIA